MAHLEVNLVGFTLPDGRPLLDGVQFRVGDGQRVALGPNGTGKTTLTRTISGDLAAHEGAASQRSRCPRGACRADRARRTSGRSP